MTRPLLLFIFALALCGCSNGYLPALRGAHAPVMGPSGPPRAQPPSEMVSIPNSEDRPAKGPMIVAGLDLMTTSGAHPDERQSLGRAHCSFTTVGKLSDFTMMSSVGLFVYDGAYRVASPAPLPPYNGAGNPTSYPVYGGGLNVSTSIFLTAGSFSFGVGDLIGVGAEFGRYHDLTDQNTIGPLVPYLGLQGIASLNLPYNIQLAAQGGVIIPGPAYLHGTITLDRLTLWGGTGTYNGYDPDLSGFAAGIAYRIQ